MKYEIVHTCIRVMDLEKSIEFYKIALNFKEVKRMVFEENRFTLVYMSDGVTGHELELTYNYDQKKPYEIGDGYSHLAVVVDDLEKSHEEHKSAGYQVTKLSSLPGNPPKFYFISDPDGYSVEIIRK